MQSHVIQIFSLLHQGWNICLFLPLFYQYSARGLGLVAAIQLTSCTQAHFCENSPCCVVKIGLFHDL